MNFKKITAVLLSTALAASVLTGCGLNKNEVVATLGSTQVKMGLVNFMCRYEQAGMDDLYRSYFGEDVWQTDLYGSGETMEETVKDEVMEYLHELYALADADHMAEYGVELTDEENAKITEVASTFMAANSKEALNEMGATQDIVEEMLRLFTIKSKMDVAIQETADTEVSDEEANMRAFTMASAGISTYLDSSTYTYVEYTEDEVAEITEAMDNLYAEIQGGADWETAADELGITVTTDTYDADDDTLEDAVKEALDGLKEGETSSLITTEEAIYIVRLDSECDEEATEENRENIIATRKEDKYEEVLTAWEEEDGWTVKESALNKISFKNVFTQETETEEAATESATEAE